MKGEWQHQIFLATIDKLDNYYSANASFVINSANIAEDGSFRITGDNLPDNPQFYRLYLIKEEHSEFNACLFVGGEEHNFIHLLLDNESTISIQADMDNYAPFGDYAVYGDTANTLMKEMAQIVYPSYIFYEIKFPSELQFSEDKLNRDLFSFADSCSNPLVALAAINNTDFDEYFEGRFDDYNRMHTTLEAQFPNHPYTQDFRRKMRYYGYETEDTKPRSLAFWAALLLGLLSIILLIQNGRLRKQLTNYVPADINLAQQKITLTSQENKILSLIKEGKSNKEIANELFIGLSTVKTHINKLYSKLGVKNRAEAMAFDKNQ